LSQLGYMTIALGASAYSVAIFHLMTHAFFKALLFLAAGSVIIGMHHDQDIRNMGGLKKYMKITWITSLLGSLALIGTPFFSGFYSKDSIIEAVKYSHVAGSGFAYFAAVIGVFVTAFYSFRMYFLVFHGEERWRAVKHDHHHHDANADQHDDHVHHGLGPKDSPHESKNVVTSPLVLLAVPSVLIGLFAIQPMLFGDYFKDVITVNPKHEAMAELAKEFHGWFGMATHALSTLPFWLMIAGVASAYYCYLVNPSVPAWFYRNFKPLHKVLDNKYYMDKFNEVVFAAGSLKLGRGLWKGGDQAIIDGIAINGSARMVGLLSSAARWLQTGYIYHYAIAMIVGVGGLLFFFVVIR
jgi:NADH-quinone oxidoreductase subunit L